jgi:hypothetical protein
MTSKSFSVRQFDIIGDSGNAVITSSEYIELNTPRVAISTDISVAGKFQSNVVLDAGYSFSGSGANLTNLPAGQLTGSLPAIDGSALTGVTATGSGVEIKDSGTLVGTASTIDFGTNLSVSPVSAGVVTVTASGGGGESYWVSTAGVGIHTTSNVGIGTTNPTSKLTVEGDVSVSGVVTATSFVGGGIPVTGIGTFDAIVGVSTVIDSFDIATENISIIEYNIFVNNGSNKIQSQKALIMLGDEAYSQEYAIIYSNNHLVSVGATISAGICNVTLTPSSGVSGLTTFKFSKGGSV